MTRNNHHLAGGALAALGLLWLAPARAAEVPLAHASLSGELLGEIVQGLLPATMAMARTGADSEEKPPRLLAVGYCGPGEKGTGRFRALASRGRGAALAGISCAGALGDWAERASPALPEGTLLLDLEASWKSWELRLAAVRALVIGQGGRPRGAPGFEQRFDLTTVWTADVHIDTGAQPIVLHAIPAFRERVVELAIVLADRAPARPPRIPASGLGWAEPANCGAEIPEAFANQILRLLTARRPVSIPLQGEELDIANVTLKDESGRLLLTGTAEPRSLRESTQWTLVAGGEPLRVASVQMAAQYEECAGLGTMAAVACKVRNGARATAAEAFARALTERYQARFVHELVSPVRLSFTVAGQRIGLYGDLLQMSASRNGLQATARLSAR